MSGDQSLPTASEGNTDFNFNGVFRDVHLKSSRDQLYDAQSLISQDKWDEAQHLLKVAIRDSSDDHDVRNLTVVLQEVARYRACKIPEETMVDEEINWDNVKTRTISRYAEKFDELPQSLFLLRSKGEDRVLVGRKVLSHQFVRNNIRELHCSHVTAAMILGVLRDQRIKEDGIVLFYNELFKSEKICLMNNIFDYGMTNYEITFPFPALISANKDEIQSPEGGWEIDEKLALSLGEGEVYLREFSVRYLKSIGRKDLRLFDCACSTGQFLFTMKQGVPGCYTIGSDLSAHMVQFATKRVDEIYCGNALEPQIPDRSVDVVFIRFINSEVVKTEIASTFLEPLTRCLKKGGSLIIFGHTPILTSAAEIQMLMPNLEIAQSIGGDKEWGGIFQYYVCKRTD